jgi:hypothetical protein
MYSHLRLTYSIHQLLQFRIFYRRSPSRGFIFLSHTVTRPFSLANLSWFIRFATVGISCSSGGRDGFGEKLCCIHGGSPFAEGGLFPPGDGVNFADRGLTSCVRAEVSDRDRGRGRVEYFCLVGER